MLPEPLEFPASCLTSVSQNISVNNTAFVPVLESCVPGADYPELRHSLLEISNQYYDAIALPGETLSATDFTEYHVKSKPGTQPIYVPAYRLPHSKREIVDNQIIKLSNC